MRRARHDDYGCSPCKLDDVGITHPIRRGNDDLVALIDGRNQRVEQRMLPARIHGDLLRRIIDVVVALELVDNGLLEWSNAINCRIFRLPVADCLNGCILNEVGRVEIGLSRRKADNIDPL